MKTCQSQQVEPAKETDAKCNKTRNSSVQMTRMDTGISFVNWECTLWIFFQTRSNIYPVKISVHCVESKQIFNDKVNDDYI